MQNLHKVVVKCFALSFSKIILNLSIFIDDCFSGMNYLKMLKISSTLSSGNLLCPLDG